MRFLKWTGGVLFNESIKLFQPPGFSGAPRNKIFTLKLIKNWKYKIECIKLLRVTLHSFIWLLHSVIRLFAFLPHWLYCTKFSNLRIRIKPLQSHSNHRQKSNKSKIWHVKYLYWSRCKGNQAALAASRRVKRQSLNRTAAGRIDILWLVSSIMGTRQNGVSKQRICKAGNTPDGIAGATRNVSLWWTSRDWRPIDRLGAESRHEIRQCAGRESVHGG